MAYIQGAELGVELCDIFQIDSHNVQSVRIDCDAFSCATLTVTRYITHDEFESIKYTLAKYKALEEGK